MDKKGIVLKPEFEKALMDLGFAEFTEIQEKCIPLIQQGKDVLGMSYTGSGKTLAFGFPALERIVPGKGIQLLVLVPTRELCNQIVKEFKKFTRYKHMNILGVYGGVSINPQIMQTKHADAVVSTPGRLLDILSRISVNMSNVRILVLDEADKMFEMGFIDDVRDIILRVPKHSQKLLFGATMSHDIMEIAKRYMNNPVKVKMQTYVDKAKLIQHYYDVDRREKFSLLVHLLSKKTKGLTIVFCDTRRMVDVVDRNLNFNNIMSRALHGGLTQSMRNQVISDFHSGRLSVLVASDVAARGLDIKNVELIINYDLPKTSEEYVHRIGRTARAGSEGKVISLLCYEDHDNFRRILQDRDILVHKLEKPDFERAKFLAPRRRPHFQQGFSRDRGRFSRGRNYGRPRF
ncbi:DEAD/DEAH box helicase [Candidatus Woesearchaeota archaeon]|nr:DEAD/DEAH box helicase [Candidatus Woesearchaeota archaeon]